MSVLPFFLEQSCSLFLPCWSLDSVQTIYTRRAMARSRKSSRNPYLFLPLVGHQFVCSNIMLQACHDEISDINLIRKCKCKNFVTGLLAHSVLKSTQMAASLTGSQYFQFRNIAAYIARALALALRAQEHLDDSLPYRSALSSSF